MQQFANRARFATLVAIPLSCAMKSPIVLSENPRATGHVDPVFWRYNSPHRNCHARAGEYGALLERKPLGCRGLPRFQVRAVPRPRRRQRCAVECHASASEIDCRRSREPPAVKGITAAPKRSASTVSPTWPSDGCRFFSIKMLTLPRD